MTDAKTHSKEAEYAFELGKEIEKKTEEAQTDLIKAKQYLAELEKAKSEQNHEKSQEVFTSFIADNSVNEANSVESDLQKSLRSEEQQMKRFVKNADEIAAEQVSLENEIKNSKAAIKATKKKKEKASIQLRIDDLTKLVEPLPAEKAAAYEMASVHEKKALEYKNELATIQSVKSEVNMEVVPETVTPEEKAALISSILATTTEVEAMESAATEKVKPVKEMDNQANESELATNETENTGVGEEANATELTNEEVVVAEGNSAEESEGVTVSEETNPPLNSPEYFEYASEYEAPVADKVEVSGVNVPLEVTTNTGKKKYTEADLKGAEIVFTESDYNADFRAQTQQNKLVDNSLEKAKQTQRINYQWVTAIEKEVAELSYAKSKSSNPGYNSRVNDKISTLNSQASQKRNFMALNAKIIKQLDAKESLAAETKTAVEPTETSMEAAETVKEVTSSENQIEVNESATEEIPVTIPVTEASTENEIVNESETASQTKNGSACSHFYRGTRARSIRNRSAK